MPASRPVSSACHFCDCGILATSLPAILVIVFQPCGHGTSGHRVEPDGKSKPLDFIPFWKIPFTVKILANVLNDRLFNLFFQKRKPSICALALIATVRKVEVVGRCSGLSHRLAGHKAPTNRSPATALVYTQGHRAPLHHHYSSTASHNPSFGLTTRAKLTFQLGHIANLTLKERIIWKKYHNFRD